MIVAVALAADKHKPQLRTKDTPVEKTEKRDNGIPDYVQLPKHVKLSKSTARDIIYIGGMPINLPEVIEEEEEKKALEEEDKH